MAPTLLVQMATRTDGPHAALADPARTRHGNAAEHTQSYFALLSDVQATLSLRNTLAAQVGPAAAAHASTPPPALAAAVQQLSVLGSALNPSSTAAGAGTTTSKRRRSATAAGSGNSHHLSAADDDFDTAAAVAGALFASAASDSAHNSSSSTSMDPLQGLGAPPASCAGWGTTTTQALSGPFKGVEYLTAERKWQAYVVDHDLTEVSRPCNGLRRWGTR